MDETLKKGISLSCLGGSGVRRVFCLGLQVMCMSENEILTQCFEREELSDKKRPDTVRCLRCSTDWFPPLCACSHSSAEQQSVCSALWRGFSEAAYSLRNAPHTDAVAGRWRRPPPHWAPSFSGSVYNLPPPHIVFSAPLSLSSTHWLASVPPSSHSSTPLWPVFCYFFIFVCGCPSRQPPSSKPAWRSSWRSSCLRSRRTSAASNPMTPNKQVRSNVLLFCWIMFIVEKFTLKL